MRPTINTEKHYVQFSLFAVGSGALVSQLIAAGNAVPVGATQVREGAKISAVYLEFWATSDDAAAGTCINTLEILPGNATTMTAAESAALDSYDNKRNILHTQMGLLGPNVQYPMALVKGWFKIPKGKQRFGKGVRLRFNLHGQSNGMSVCGFAIYKEQF